MVDPVFAFHPIFSTGSGLWPDEQVAVFELAGDGWMDYFVLLKLLANPDKFGIADRRRRCHGNCSGHGERQGSRAPYKD
jgi:hypothetical protein